MERIKELRRKAGVTQAEMGQRLGISESGYCLIENGKRRMTIDVAINIAKILKSDLDDIFLPDNFAKCQGTTGTEG